MVVVVVVLVLVLLAAAAAAAARVVGDVIGRYIYIYRGCPIDGTLQISRICHLSAPNLGIRVPN